MKINLLPIQYKKFIKDEAAIRALTLMAVFLISWTAVVFFLVGQAWFYVDIQKGALVQRLIVEEKSAATQEAFESQLNETDELLQYVSAVSGGFYDDGATLVRLVGNLVPAGVSLRSFEFNNETRTVSIAGDAETRNQFLAFEEALREQTLYFSQVESPISNLLKPENVQFNFKILLK